MKLEGLLTDYEKVQSDIIKFLLSYIKNVCFLMILYVSSLIVMLLLAGLHL